MVGVDDDCPHHDRIYGNRAGVGNRNIVLVTNGEVALDGANGIVFCVRYLEPVTVELLTRERVGFSVDSRSGRILGR